MHLLWKKCLEKVHYNHIPTRTRGDFSMVNAQAMVDFDGIRTLSPRNNERNNKRIRAS